MSACNPELITHRNHAGKTAIIFVHGFCGHAETTWSSFPDFLANDNRINDWDIFSLGYASSMLPDLTGIWQANPPILSLADGLRTAADLSPFLVMKSVH